MGGFDSTTGYAWLLVQRLWCIINTHVVDEPGACLACFPSVRNYPRILEKCNIPIDEFDFSFDGFKQSFCSLLFLIRNNIGVVYLTDKPTVSWSYFLLHLLGIRIIVHDHSPGYKPPTRGVKRIIKIIINALGLFSVDGAIGVSPYVCRRLSEVNCLPKSKIHLVTNGIEKSKYYKRYNLKENPEKKIIIVTVGRVVEYKGIGFALEVIRNLQEKIPEVEIRYIVVGDGPDLDKYKSMSGELGLEKKVEFLGKRDDVPKILSKCDIAFHPSKGEAMCLSIVEYMRAALPVVTSTNISVNSILEEGLDSWFFHEGDVSDASEKIKNLTIDKEKRKRLGVKARENYLRKYQEDQMVKLFITVMKKLVDC